MRWLAGLAALIAAILGAHVALDRLAAERAAERMLRAEATSPALLVQPGLAIVAADRHAATAALARRVGDVASAERLRLGGAIHMATDDAVPDGFVAIDIAAIAPEAVLRGFADRIERGSPAIRLAIDAMRPVSGNVALKARAIAPWRRR